MTIHLGRRRLVLTVKLTTLSPRLGEEAVAVALDDRSLARLNRSAARDLDCVRWAGLGLLYGRTEHQ